MKEIEQINTWLGQRMKNMSEAELNRARLTCRIV